MTEPIEEILSQLEKEIQVVKDLEEELKQAGYAKSQAEKAYKEAYRAEEKLRNQFNDKKHSIKRLEAEKESMLRLQAAKLEKEAREAEYTRVSNKLDELTSSAHWREFAFDHQIEGGKKLAVAKRGILGDKRGLGKTLTSLIWLDMAQAKKVLVIAINDVVPQFIEEINQWAPNRHVWPLQNLPPSQRSIIYPMLKMQDEFIITINFEAWRKDKTVIDDLISAGIDTVIIDEAHKIKSSDKVTARGVFQIVYKPNKCNSCGAVANHFGPWVIDGRQWDYKPVVRTAKDSQLWSTLASCDSCGARGEENFSSTVERVLSMTGTPILNSPKELFSLLYLIDPVRYRSEKSYLADYTYQYAPNKFKFKAGSTDRLTKQMSDFFIVRTREDAGIKIPPPAIKVYNLEKDIVKYKKQYEAEKTLQDAATLITESGEAYDMLYLLELILRARQIMTWPAGIILRDRESKEIICKFDVEESQKLDAVADLVSDLLDEEERVVVFSQFKEPLNELQRRFYQRGTTTAHGDTPKYIRDKIREDFDLKSYTNSDRTPRFSAAFATYKAFSTGVNLNAARHVIMLDDEWNPGMAEQAIGRIDRLNSVDQANVHIFRVKNSIDDFMNDLLEQKRDMLDEFSNSFASAQELMKGITGNF